MIKISENAFHKEEEVRNLLLKAILDFNEVQVNAWMNTYFDPKNMFCCWQDEQLISCIQLRYVHFQCHKETIKTTQIVLSALHPDYQQTKLFTKLLDIVLEKANANTLLSFCFTNTPQLYTPKHFQVVAKPHAYWIHKKYCMYHTKDSILPYHQELDVYPLYKAFIQNFDGSVQLTKDQWNTQLQYALESNHKVICATCDNQVTGLGIYQVYEDYVHFDTLIYLDSIALFNLFHYASYESDNISLRISEDERLEKIFPFHFKPSKENIMIRINQPKLLSKLLGTNIKSGKDVFKYVNAPSWNHFV